MHRAEGGQDGHEHGDQADADELTATSTLASFCLDRPVLAVEEIGRFAVTFGEAGIEEGLLGGGQLHRRRGDPPVHLFDETAAEEVAVGTIRGDPFAHRFGESTLDTDVVAGLEAGMRTVLVLTGITHAADVDRFPFRPSRIVDSIADLVDDLPPL